MTAAGLLADLRARGVQLTPEGTALRYRAPKGALTPELRQAVAAHKADLLRLLSTPALDADAGALAAVKLAGTRLDLAECVALIHVAFAALAAEYVEGTFAQLESDPDFARRFHDAEAAIDAAVKAGPTEAELRAALALYAGVVREGCQRIRAQREAAAERPDPMPDLPDNTTRAVGFGYGDGQPGTWDVLRRAR